MTASGFDLDVGFDPGRGRILDGDTGHASTAGPRALAQHSTSSRQLHPVVDPMDLVGGHR
jgi:hypothetical protein